MVIPGLQLCKPSGSPLVGKPEPDERLTEAMAKVDVFWSYGGLAPAERYPSCSVKPACILTAGPTGS